MIGQGMVWLFTIALFRPLFSLLEHYLWQKTLIVTLVEVSVFIWFFLNMRQALTQRIGLNFAIFCSIFLLNFCISIAWFDRSNFLDQDATKWAFESILYFLTYRFACQRVDQIVNIFIILSTVYASGLLAMYGFFGQLVTTDANKLIVARVLLLTLAFLPSLTFVRHQKLLFYVVPFLFMFVGIIYDSRFLVLWSIITIVTLLGFKSLIMMPISIFCLLIGIYGIGDVYLQTQIYETFQRLTTTDLEDFTSGRLTNFIASIYGLLNFGAVEFLFGYGDRAGHVFIKEYLTIGFSSFQDKPLLPHNSFTGGLYVYGVMFLSLFFLLLGAIASSLKTRQQLFCVITIFAVALWDYEVYGNSTIFAALFLLLCQIRYCKKQWQAVD